MTRSIFQLESGITSTTKATKDFFNENPLFTLEQPIIGQPITFKGIGGQELTTSPVKNLSKNIDENTGRVIYARIETKHSIIQIFNIMFTKGTDYTTVPIPR